MNNFADFAYEEIALNTEASSEFPNYIFGRWWDKEEEIDVFGLDSSKTGSFLARLIGKPL